MWWVMPEQAQIVIVNAALSHIAIYMDMFMEIAWVGTIPVQFGVMLKETIFPVMICRYRENLETDTGLMKLVQHLIEILMNVEDLEYAKHVVEDKQNRHNGETASTAQ